MPLAGTLTLVAAALAGARDPWWVIGSAAVRLHGVATDVADVDVLASERDAAAVLARLGLPVEEGMPDDRFRSAMFARWAGAPLDVEIMAGLHVRTPDGWVAVRAVPERTIVRSGVRIPDRDALLEILRLFGREKDMRRAADLSIRGPC